VYYYNLFMRKLFVFPLLFKTLRKAFLKTKLKRAGKYFFLLNSLKYVCQMHNISLTGYKNQSEILKEISLVFMFSFSQDNSFSFSVVV